MRKKIELHVSGFELEMLRRAINPAVPMMYEFFKKLAKAWSEGELLEEPEGE
jgi:hypothetical protein